MWIEAGVAYSCKSPLAMAAALHAPLSLDILPDEGRCKLGRQGSLTPGSSSPSKVDWRACAGLSGMNSIRRSLSVGSELSDFLGSTSSRKSLEENSSMRRSGSRGCLESLDGAGMSNVRAMVDHGMRGEDRWERLEEDRPGVISPSAQIFSQDQCRQSMGKESFPRPRKGCTQINASAPHQSRKYLPESKEKKKKNTKSIVLEQAQESFDSLKDRLESSLKVQPECSYAPPSPPSPVTSNAAFPPCKDTAIYELANDVSGLKLSTLPRSLKRRKNKEKNLATARSCAVSNAFSALVFIIKSMHGHALKMKEENHLLPLVAPMHREMDLSFAWLFQHVFARTPEYMLSVMILLANFTVHYLGKDVALAAMANSTPPQASTNSTAPGSPTPKEGHLSAGMIREKKASLSVKSGDAGGVSSESAVKSEELALQALMTDAMKELKSTSGWHPLPLIDQDVAKRLVAPVRVALFPDDYLCFDRTDLEYQHAISEQPTNVMVLSNYAQFLYVVRHDNNRAEDYFHRAIREDPCDGEVLGRFATFLWRARGDKETAERAFRAAAALDPTNPYHAGNYTHFLWHAEDSKYPKCSATCYVGNA